MAAIIDKGPKMQRMQSHFLALGAIYLVIGLSLGLHMGASHDFRFAPVHAHINLVGFVLHSAFALIYRAWPALADTILAKVHFWLFIIFSPILMVGIALTVISGQELPVMIGSMGVFLGILAYVVNVLRFWATAKLA
jgi:hypothetical protein